MNNTRTCCPFCKTKESTVRGEGCCNCEYLGTVPIGESCNFKSMEEAASHDPGISYYDLNQNRKQGRPLNYTPF